MNQQISAQSQKLLLQIGRKIRRTLDLHAIWQQTVNSVGQTLGVSRCIICPYPSSSEQLKVAAEYCQEPFLPMLGMEISLTSAPDLIEALASLEPVVIESFKADDPFERKSVLVVATAYQEQPNGIISLHRCEDEWSRNGGNADRPSWTQDQIEFAQELADQVGSATALATLYQESSERTQEISKLKKQFLLSASHELRTPLNHIIGYLQLTIDDQAEDATEERDFIQEAHRSAIHLSKVISNILDYIQVSEGCQTHSELADLRSKEESRHQ
ncbi:GAF domain-containing protein [Microcoleus sp. LEGE 07076]|uniref:GAF domain-containing sensor histidine kinase n=1 Tax=Microcoleus sp. LEGE 07076 TaxID=915322 RepID=UPI00187E8921|nr:histidine kinase dimerization/phospho-acceptor domain-containing protein [Microcoleus sp. LEGE 07076]MBE9187055.1 GAF domain-containing protein [Microcoleus sp. LEGE 07076]